jgi:hypothetical protein
MKKIMFALVLGILAISMLVFVLAEENNSNQNQTDDEQNNTVCSPVCDSDEICVNSVCVDRENDNETEDEDDNETNDDDNEDNETEIQVCLTLKTETTCETKKNCVWDNETDKCAKAVKTQTHKLKETLQAYLNSTECPEDCVCAGSTIKCETENGREMTVVAGKSGNVIIITKGVNASTKVILIKNASGVYGNFSKKMKKVKYMPDEIKEFVLKKLKLENASNYNMTLGEDGNYTMNIDGKYNVFWIFPKKGIVVTKVNSETGDVTVLKKPFWKFRAE